MKLYQRNKKMEEVEAMMKLAETRKINDIKNLLVSVVVAARIEPARLVLFFATNLGWIKEHNDKITLTEATIIYSKLYPGALIEEYTDWDEWLLYRGIVFLLLSHINTKYKDQIKDWSMPLSYYNRFGLLGFYVSLYVGNGLYEEEKIEEAKIKLRNRLNIYGLVNIPIKLYLHGQI